MRGLNLRQFSVELEDLHEKVLQMGGYVESAIHRSVRALVDRDPELARQVLRDEARINQMEIEIDNLTTRLFALRQPMAQGPALPDRGDEDQYRSGADGRSGGEHRAAGSFAGGTVAGKTADRYSAHGAVGGIDAAAHAGRVRERATPRKPSAC